jgi:hypothetical protein
MRYTPFGTGLKDFARRQGYPDYETYNRVAIDAGDATPPKLPRLPSLKHEETMYKKNAKVLISGTSETGIVDADSGNVGAWVRRDSDGLKYYLPVDMLETAIDPQLGDMYRDKDGNEWVAVNDHMNHSGNQVILRSIDVRNEGLYYTNPGMATSQGLSFWVKKYSPVLVRRRGE